MLLFETILALLEAPVVLLLAREVWGPRHIRVRSGSPSATGGSNAPSGTLQTKPGVAVARGA
jgi:hypothetical protein